MTPISEMTPAEMNEAVAVEVMEWVWVWRLDVWKTLDNHIVYSKWFNPSENHTDCHHAEERMRDE